MGFCIFYVDKMDIEKVSTRIVILDNLEIEKDLLDCKI